MGHGSWVDDLDLMLMMDPLGFCELFGQWPLFKMTRNFRNLKFLKTKKQRTKDN